MLVVLLRHAGFHTACAGDGEALAASEKEFDVIIRDVSQRPGQDDGELASVEALPPEILRRTVITTTAPASVIRSDWRVRPFAILRKPFEVESLVQTVRDCARNARPRARPRSRSPRTSAEEDGGRAVDLPAVERFIRSLPELRALIADGTESPQELLLRNEIRTAAMQLWTLLGEAAEGEQDFTRATVLRGGAVAASELASTATGARARRRSGTGH